MDADEKLKKRLQQQKKHLDLWKQNLEAVKQTQPQYDQDLQQKLHILTRIKQIDVQPYHTDSEIDITNAKMRREINRIDDIEVVSFDSQDPISTELKLNLQLPSVYADIIPLLEDKIRKKELKLKELQFLDEDVDLQALRDRTKELTKFLKTVISKFLFQYEFKKIFHITGKTSQAQLDRIMTKKEKFIKLLETLLNNAVVGDNQKWILLSERDDALIRFLVLNQLVIVDPGNKNRIKLKTSVDDLRTDV